MVVDCPMVITSIGDTLFQTRLEQEETLVTPVFCVVDTGSCFNINPKNVKGTQR